MQTLPLRAIDYYKKDGDKSLGQIFNTDEGCSPFIIVPNDNKVDLFSHQSYRLLPSEKDIIMHSKTELVVLL